VPQWLLHPNLRPTVTQAFSGPFTPLHRATILWMPTDQILSLLLAERDKLNRAIEALQGPTKRRGRLPKNPTLNHPSVPDGVKPASAKTPVHRKRTMSAAGRKAIRDAVRKRWALIRAGKVASPFAKRKAEAKVAKKAVRKSKKAAKAA
jgi:hypothetical protein